MSVGRILITAFTGGLALTGVSHVPVESVAGLFQSGPDSSSTGYDFGAVEGAEIVKTVTATGSVASTINVEVGAQLSGQIMKLRADFNDSVRKDQVLAELDDSTFRVQVDSARAALQGAEADVRVAEAKLVRARIDAELLETQRDVMTARLEVARSADQIARREAQRKSELGGKGVIASSEADNSTSRADAAAAVAREAEANLEGLKIQSDGASADIARAIAELDSARAAVLTKKAQLEAASIDLERTRIRSPIDGVIIGRNVEEGQTLASTLETRTLFVIAGDLRRMEVRTRVDESDISQVQVGQPVEFTVDSYPGRRFEATVSQIRKEPQIIQNVVTYIVVLTASNDDYALLPGMTVVAKIETARAIAALTVPLAALRFHPRGLDASASSEPKGSTVWILREGALTPIPVTVGNQDDERAAITSGNLTPGEPVLTGEPPPGASVRLRSAS